MVHWISIVKTPISRKNIQPPPIENASTARGREREKDAVTVA
jgi:hypothetical protein